MAILKRSPAASTKSAVAGRSLLNTRPRRPPRSASAPPLELLRLAALALALAAAPPLRLLRATAAFDASAAASLGRPASGSPTGSPVPRAPRIRTEAEDCSSSTRSAAMESYSGGDNAARGGAEAVRILALHGKGGTGPEFEVRLAPLAEALAGRTSRPVEIDCPTAPFELGPSPEDGTAWWTLPPGVRSFNAEEYLGFERSAALVTEALNGGGVGEGYDLVLGHSQGAILLSALLARGDLPPPPRAGPRQPRGYVLNGAAWPNPFSSALTSLCLRPEESSSAGPAMPSCLFVVGDADRINPPEGARRVRDALSVAGVGADTIDHPGGHSVPANNPEALAKMVKWMTNALEG